MARTGENIYKRKDGRWEARFIYKYDAEGKPRYRSAYGKSRHEAKQKRQALIHEHITDLDDSIPCTLSFKELANKWLNNTRLRVKESSFARYYSLVNKHILPTLGKYQTSKISTELIENMISELLQVTRDNGRCLSPKTVEDIMIIIKSILKFGKCDGKLELSRIKIKKDDRRPLALKRTEYLALHQYLCRDCDYIKAGILLCLHIGIRIGELCALRWSDINLDEKSVHIERTIQRIQVLPVDRTENKTKVVISSPKSRTSIRDIPISSLLAAILRRLPQPSDGFVLTGNTNYMEPRTLQNHFKKCLLAAGIRDYNFHTLRHTMATSYIEAGFDVKSLSEILGHSSVKITLERYVHSSIELKRSNMEKLIDTLNYSSSELPSKQSA